MEGRETREGEGQEEGGGHARCSGVDPVMMIGIRRVLVSGVLAVLWPSCASRPSTVRHPPRTRRGDAQQRQRELFTTSIVHLRLWLPVATADPFVAPHALTIARSLQCSDVASCGRTLVKFLLSLVLSL